MKARAIALTLFLVAGCGGEPTEEPVPEMPVRELPQPLLKMIAPSSVRAGDTITIFGQGFADKAIGQTRVTFDGVYQTMAGKVHQVSLELVPRYENQGMASWYFGPNIPFSPEGETGFFRGIIKAKNVGYDGSEKHAPQALGTEIQVLPSILIQQMRPTDAGCPVGITDTVEGTNFMFELEAAGLKSGSQIAPLRFIYSFLKENFRFNGYLLNQTGIDPESLFPETGPVTIIDDVDNGNVSKLGTGVPRNVSVQKGGYTPSMASAALGMESLFGLTHLQTAEVPTVAGNYAADYFDANMNVLAIDSSGQEASRTITLRVWTPIEVAYKGDSEIARIFDPVPVSSCIPGGDIGREVSYSENVSETRSRQFTVSSKVGGGIDIKVVRLNAEFGIDVTSQVTSATSTDLKISGFILPNQFAVFYRQTIQLEKKANLKRHGACGSTQDIGEVVVTDWTWSPDLAKGSVCPPLPPSNLPPGRSFKEE